MVDGKNKYIFEKTLIFIYCMSAITFISFTWGKYLMLASVGTLAIRMLAKGMFNIRKADAPFLVVGLSFSAMALFSCLWSWNFDYAKEMGITITEVFVFSYIIYLFIKKTNTANSFAKILMLSGYVYAMVVLFDFGVDSLIRISADSTLRENTAYGNLNYIGMIMTMNLIMTVHDFIFNKPKIYHLFSLVSILVLAGTQSRTAMIGLAAGILLLFYFKIRIQRDLPKKIKHFTLVLVGVLLIFILVRNTGIFSGVNDRIDELILNITGSKGGDNSSRVRLKLIESGMEQFWRTPLIGIGINNSKLVALSAVGHEYYLHNNFVDLLVNVGIIGFAIYYSFYLLTVANLLREKKRKDPIKYLIIACLVVLLLMDYGTVSYYQKYTFMFFILFFSGTELISKNSLTK